MTPTITVIGGLTMDLTYFVDKWPTIGKAVQAKSYKLAPGGKGLNQVTSLKRSGASVQFIGSVGNDTFSQEIFYEMEKDGLETKNIFKFEMPTDLIGIIVDSLGMPGFIGIKQSTSKLSPQDIESKIDIIQKSNALLVNSEISKETAIAALKLAKEKGITTIFNPAPPELLPTEFYSFIDYLVLNSWEAKVILGLDNLSTNQMAKELIKLGVKNICITSGKEGCVMADSKGITKFLAFSVKEVDETGAGDSFLGYFANSISTGDNINTSIRIASAAGALACTKVGGQTSPTAIEVSNFLDENKDIKL